MMPWPTSASLPYARALRVCQERERTRPSGHFCLRVNVAVASQ
jgi:hypothetical protein